MLPTLPSLGGSVDYLKAIELIRNEGDKSLSYLADLLEAELAIEEYGLKYYVENEKDFSTDLPLSLPNNFVTTFETYKDLPEWEWLTNVYLAWFKLLIDTGDKGGADLLVKWAAWELCLRSALLTERFAEEESSSQGIKALIDKAADYEWAEEAMDIVTSYKAFSEPYEAEKFLDETRIEFLRANSEEFSFGYNELIAYMLELRIHNRYSKLQPEVGSKILEEVTRL